MNLQRAFMSVEERKPELTCLSLILYWPVHIQAWPMQPSAHGNICLICRVQLLGYKPYKVVP